MELRWSRRQPRRLDDYQSEYPSAFGNRKILADLAFEEYRQRLQAGECVTADEYRQRYEIDVSDWPPPESVSPPTQVLDDDGNPSLGEKTDDLYRQLSGQEPEAAARLKTARQEMPKVGDHFLGFELIRELGRGAFGCVFLARQAELANRLVALKVSANLGGEPQRLAQLQHTNIMPVFSTHRQGMLEAVCMPYWGSATLADVIHHVADSGHSLPETGHALLQTVFDSRLRRSVSHKTAELEFAQPPYSETTQRLLSQLSHVDAVLWLFARLADGLAHAHERGILHRDLKPANILLTDDGQPMLLDFNLAADIKPSSGWVARMGGTLPYMAPEVLAAHRNGKYHFDARSDLYAVGLMLYKLLTGKSPYPIPPCPSPGIIDVLIAQRQKPAASARRLNPRISPAVDAVVRKLLEPDPKRRYASAAELREDLERQLSHRPLRHARDVSPIERFKKWRRRHPKFFAVGAAVLAVFGLLVLPVSAFAVRQKQLAEHRLSYEQSAAVVRQQQAIDEARHAQILLSTQTGSRVLLDQGFEKARHVLTLYGIHNDASWRQQRFVQALPAEQQDELQTEIGELLFLMARGEQLRNDAKMALHWNHLAEACFPAERQPARLRRQRSELEGAPVAPQQAAARTDRDDYHAGLELAAQTKYRSALAHLLPFTEKNPRHFMSWYVRGICHDGVGQLAEAGAAFTVCVSLRPEFEWGYFSRGRVRLQQKRFDLAEEDFTRCMELKPDWTWPIINRAIAREGRRDWQGAENDLNNVLARPECPPRIYFLRAKIRSAMGDRTGAAKDEAEGLKRTPADCLSWVTRGVWQMEKRPEAALVDFTKALELDPRSRDALQNQAVVLADYLHRPKEAVAAMDRLLEMYPDYVEARAGRGVYLARIGEIERAREDADACLLVEPTPFRYYQMAGLYAQLTRFDADAKLRGKAMRYLAHAFRNGFADFELMKNDPDIEPLRKDEEFLRIVAHAKALNERK